jgi:hypothetical protein
MRLGWANSGGRPWGVVAAEVETDDTDSLSSTGDQVRLDGH